MLKWLMNIGLLRGHNEDVGLLRTALIQLTRSDLKLGQASTDDINLRKLREQRCHETYP